jgi:hypothetical protein
MKKYHLAVLIVALIFFLGKTSIAADLQEGFMRYQWGENISIYPGLTKLYSKRNVAYYSNPGESYIVDDISVDNVVFGFYKESLFAVYIRIGTLDKFDQIRQHLKIKYGLPGTKVSAKDYVDTLSWKYQDVTIKLKTDQIEGKMKLAFYYRPLSRALNANELKEISETSFKFFPVDKSKKPDGFRLLEF